MASARAKHTPQTTVAVIGLGYVGLPLALLCARKGYHVIGVDIDREKIAVLNRRKSPFHDEAVAKELADTTAKFYSDARYIRDARTVIICVPTPVYHDHMPNLEPLISASETVGANIARGTNVIIESTINPGVSETVVLPVLEKLSGMKAGEDFEVSHCPERVNPGDTGWSVALIPRVAGSLTHKGLSDTIAFYESVLDAPVHPMGNLREAEAVKVVENSFRDINIAFVNELAMSFAKLGIDVVNVIKGASTKPFSFMAHFPGCGVGGHCIPVDPYYLIEYGKENGFNHEFLSMARKINNRMPVFTVELAEKFLKEKGTSLSGSVVAVLGLSYKSNVDDTRESPSFDIINALKTRGARVIAYDPYVPKLSDTETLDEAISHADAVIIATAHREFRTLTPKHFKDSSVRCLIDGRNCLDKEEFRHSAIVYAGIGR